MNRLSDPTFLRLPLDVRAVLHTLDMLINKNDLIKFVSMEEIVLRFFPYGIRVNPIKNERYVVSSIKGIFAILKQEGFIQLLSKKDKFFIRVVPKYGKPKSLLMGYKIIGESCLVSQSFIKKDEMRPWDYHVLTKPDLRQKNKVTKKDIEVVFETWVEATDKRRVKLTVRRETEIRSILREYPIEEVLLAVKGIVYSGWHCGDNPNGEKYLDLKVIFKNIEKFRDLAEENNEQPFQ